MSTLFFKLRVLILSYNNIEFLPNFDLLKDLSFLNLENNWIKEIHAHQFAYMYNLQNIYLKNNQIEAIGEHAFSGIPTENQIETNIILNNTINYEIIPKKIILKPF